MELPNLLAEMFPNQAGLESVVRLCDVSSRTSKVYNDLHHEKLVVTV